MQHVIFVYSLTIFFSLACQSIKWSEKWVTFSDIMPGKKPHILCVLSFAFSKVQWTSQLVCSQSCILWTSQFVCSQSCILWGSMNLTLCVVSVLHSLRFNEPHILCGLSLAFSEPHILCVLSLAFSEVQWTSHFVCSHSHNLWGSMNLTITLSEHQVHSMPLSFSILTLCFHKIRCVSCAFSAVLFFHKTCYALCFHDALQMSDTFCASLNLLHSYGCLFCFCEVHWISDAVCASLYLLHSCGCAVCFCDVHCMSPAFTRHCALCFYDALLSVFVMITMCHLLLLPFPLPDATEVVFLACALPFHDIHCTSPAFPFTRHMFAECITYYFLLHTIWSLLTHI